MNTKPYDRQQEETPPAYEAFVIYRDMGAQRTIKGAARQIGKHPAHLEKWSRKHKWVERSRAWDSELDRRKRLGELKAVEKMRERQIEMAMMMQGIANEEILKLARKALAEGTELVIDPDLILKFAKEGTGLERLVRGEPGEIIQASVEYEVDYTLLNLDEIKAIRSAKRKLKDKDKDE